MHTSDPKRVVHYEGNLVVVGDLGDLGQRRDCVLGVADALDVDRLRLVVNRCGEGFGLLAVHKLDGDVEPLQEYCGISYQLQVQAYVGSWTSDVPLN